MTFLWLTKCHTVKYECALNVWIVSDGFESVYKERRKEVEKAA